MSLADRHEAGPPQRRKPCHIRAVLTALPDAEAAALQRMLDDPKWADRKTFDALLAESVEGLPETDQFIGKHRRRDCDCT